MSAQQNMRLFYIECNYTAERRDQLFQLLTSDKTIRADCHEDLSYQRKIVHVNYLTTHYYQCIFHTYRGEKSTY
jgi:hypothetical protein